MNKRILLLILSVGLLATARAQAGCDCGRTDTSNPCTGNSASRVIGGHTITFRFNADGEDCQCGRFVNGEVWVVPRTASGRSVAEVTITAIEPAGENNGAESNPYSEDDHAVLMKWGTYNASRNIINLLPYGAKPGESIIKAVEKLPSSDCGTNATKTRSCAGAFDVLTVISEVPPDNGSTIFRPPYAGTEKPLRSISNVHFERLPRIDRISASPYQADFATVIKHWNSPQYELTHAHGEMMRATTPMDVLGNDYAANTAATYLGGLLSVFGTETDAQKAKAVYALMQPGFDNYAIYKMGIPFHSGAGQHLGKKPQIVFAAAMYNDQQMLDDIRGAAVRTDEAWFQEDEQIFTIAGHSTTPVWGNREDGTAASGSATWYWHTLFLRWKDGVENKKTLGDWHGYIDGPGGGADNASYQFCCSTGPFAAFVLAQHLMPWMEYANNDEEILTYIDRVWNGRGIDNFTGGWWGAPDPCAPVDPRESTDCDVRYPNTCQYYKVTWGPDPANSSECIKHNGDPMTDGRYSSLHGKVVAPTTWGRLPKLALTNWAVYRDCADPDHTSYPCAGMGPEVDGSPVREAALNPGQLPVQITVQPNPMREKVRFLSSAGTMPQGVRVKIYNSYGVMITSFAGGSIPGLVQWEGETREGRQAKAGIYYYSLSADGITSTGRIMKLQ